MNSKKNIALAAAFALSSFAFSSYADNAFTVGETSYATLNAALSAGNVVNMSSDYTGNITITTGKTLVIDKNITIHGAVTVNAGANLVMSAGRIERNVSSGGAIVLYGNAEISGGTVVGIGTGALAINFLSGCTASITGGEFIATGRTTTATTPFNGWNDSFDTNFSGELLTCSSELSGDTYTIHGIFSDKNVVATGEDGRGYKTLANAFSASDKVTLKKDLRANVSIESGKTFIINSDVTIYGQVNVKSGATLLMSAGKIERSSDSGSTSSTLVVYGNAEISGGSVAGVGPNMLAAHLMSGSTTNFTGGEFVTRGNAKSRSCVSNESGSNYIGTNTNGLLTTETHVTEIDGTYTNRIQFTDEYVVATDENGIGYKTLSEAFKGGNVITVKKDISGGAGISSGKTLIIDSNVTVSGQVRVNEGGTLQMSDGNIIRTGIESSSSALAIMSGGTAILTGGNIIGEGSASIAANFVSGCSAQVSGGKFIAKGRPSATASSNAVNGWNAKYSTVPSGKLKSFQIEEEDGTWTVTTYIVASLDDAIEYDSNDMEISFNHDINIESLDDVESIITAAKAEDDYTAITAIDLTRAVTNNVSAQDIVNKAIELGASANMLLYVKDDCVYDGTTKNIVILSNGEYKCKRLELTDNNPYSSNRAFKAERAVYSRNVSSTWGTLILPYEVKDVEGSVNYYSVASSDADGESILVVPAYSVAANSPVLFKKTGANNMSFASTNVMVEPTTTASKHLTSGNIQFKGCYTTNVITTGLDDIYYISQNKFKQATNSVTINPFRSYIEYVKESYEDSYARVRPSFSIYETEEEDMDTMADGIVTNGYSKHMPVRYFNIDGAEKSSSTKGITIIRCSDGTVKKVIE